MGYFIVYSYIRGGNVVGFVEGGINSIGIIREIERRIQKEQGFDNVVLTHYQPLQGELVSDQSEKPG